MVTVNKILNTSKYATFVGLFIYFGPSTFFLFKKNTIGIIFFIWFATIDLLSIYDSAMAAPITYILILLLLISYFIASFITMREINASKFPLQQTIIIFFFTILLSFAGIEFEEKVSKDTNYFIVTHDLFTEPTKSMDDTLTDPSLIIVSKKKKLERGDIVNFQTEKSGGFLKRCVAISGDKFFFKDGVFHLIKKGEDKVIKEPFKEYIKYIDFVPRPSIFKEKTIEVPEGYFLALGDNRNNSHDGRYFGLVKEENIDFILIQEFFNFRKFRFTNSEY